MAIFTNSVQKIDEILRDNRWIPSTVFPRRLMMERMDVIETRMYNVMYIVELTIDRKYKNA